MVARSAHRELARAELDLPVTSCAGNPFLLTQAGAAARTGASAEGLGSDPNRLLVARFSGLAPEVVRIAKAASVAGTRFWPQLVSAMTGTSHAEVSSALGALINAGLARANEDGESSSPTRGSPKRCLKTGHCFGALLVDHLLIGVICAPAKAARASAIARSRSSVACW